MSAESNSEQTLGPPDRIWLLRNDTGSIDDCWQMSTIEGSGDIEYARVSKHYFCSCGAACTAEEYLDHLFRLDHDRVIEVTPRVSANVVVDDLVRDAGAIIIVNEGDAGARVEIRFSELQDAQRLHKALAKHRAAASTVAPVEQDEARWKDVKLTAEEILSYLNFDCSLDAVQEDVSAIAYIIFSHSSASTEQAGKPPPSQFEVWWKGEIASDFVQQALDELEKISCVKLSGGFGPEATAVSAARRKLDSALSTLREANTVASKSTSAAAAPSAATQDEGLHVAEDIYAATKQFWPTAPSSQRARDAAEEIREWIGISGFVDGEGINEVAAIIERHCFSGPAKSVDHAGLRSELDEIRKRLNEFHAEYERPIVVKDIKRLVEICDLLLLAQ